MSLSALPPTPSPSSPPTSHPRSLWHRSPASAARVTVRSSAFRPSRVSLSPQAAVSIRAILRSASTRGATDEQLVSLEAELVAEAAPKAAHTTAGREQRLLVHIHSAAESGGHERRSGGAEGAGSDDGDDEQLATGEASTHLRIAVKRRRPSVGYASPVSASACWSAEEYSAELEQLTRRMDSHRLHPAMHRYMRAFGAVQSDASTQQLHIECLSPSLALHFTPLLPSAVTLHPSPLLHSLLSHGPALPSFASLSSTPSSGYLTLTAEQHVRLVSMPSEVLSLPLLGVYSSSPVQSLSTFVQCVHFLYSHSISRLTVAPLTFLLLSTHTRCAQLYEVTATMDAVAVEHCEADIALAAGASQRQLSAPLRSLSVERIRQLWGDSSDASAEGGNGQPLLSASTATTETSASTACSSGSSSHSERGVTSWQGVYSDGESELGGKQWPASPMSLRSPSPLPVSPPKPQQQKQQPLGSLDVDRSSRALTASNRQANAADKSAAPHALRRVSSSRVAHRSAAATAEHLSRAKTAAAHSSEAQDREEAKKRQLQAVSARMRARRAAELAARKQHSATTVAGIEKLSGHSSDQLIRPLQQRSSGEAVDCNVHVNETERGHNLSNDAQPERARGGDREQHRSFPRSPLEHAPHAVTRVSADCPPTVAVRAPVVRVDDTRSECETEERRRDVQRQRKERLERRLARASQYGAVEPTTRAGVTTLKSQHQPELIAQPPSVAPSPQPHVLPTASLTPVELLSWLASTASSEFIRNATPPSTSPHVAVNHSLYAAVQLLQLLLQAATQDRPPQPVSHARESETTSQQVEPSASTPTVGLSSPITSAFELQQQETMPSTTASDGTAAAERSERGEQRSESPYAPRIELSEAPAEAGVSDSSQQGSASDAVTAGEDAHRGWMRAEEQKYPLSPHSSRDEGAHDAVSKNDQSDAGSESDGPTHQSASQWGVSVLQQLSSSNTAASTRSASPSHSQSTLSWSPSRSVHSDESSGDDWAAAPMTVAQLHSPLSLEHVASTALASPSTQPLLSSSAYSPLLDIPRISTVAVTRGSTARALEWSSNEDGDEDDEEETLLSKYDHSWNRQPRGRGRV